jgi:hypothetical protein
LLCQDLTRVVSKYVTTVQFIRILKFDVIVSGRGVHDALKIRHFLGCALYIPCGGWDWDCGSVGAAAPTEFDYLYDHWGSIRSLPDAWVQLCECQSKHARDSESHLKRDHNTERYARKPPCPTLSSPQSLVRLLLLQRIGCQKLVQKLSFGGVCSRSESKTLCKTSSGFPLLTPHLELV